MPSSPPPISPRLMSPGDAHRPGLRRTWLFGPGADQATHGAMARAGADVLIQDLEDFTPPEKRQQARALAPALYQQWRDAGALVCVRINSLQSTGYEDLQAVMQARPDIVAYPKAADPRDIHALDVALANHESALGIPNGMTEIFPVCETALGVVNVRALAGASTRVRYALLGAEDLAADLCAERTREAGELHYARGRFLLECRAAAIEPVDAPYTFSDAAGAAQEAGFARRLGYRCKSLVRPGHVAAVHEALVPSAIDIARAHAIILAFEAARSRGQERALVEGLWVEVPTYLNAKRLVQPP